MWLVNVNKELVQQHWKGDLPEYEGPVVAIWENGKGPPSYCYELEFPPGSRMVQSKEAQTPDGARVVIHCPTPPKVIR